MLPFAKLVGAGNDFVFVLESDLPPHIDRPQFSKEICSRNFGVGADGFVILSKKDRREGHFVWDFYNSDGSKAEMCGNAARCAVEFVAQKFSLEKCEFETLAGLVSGEKLTQGTAVQWDIGNNKTKALDIGLENFMNFKGHFINTGVPHFVITNPTPELTQNDCLAIQTHPQFGKANTNVTVLNVDNSGKARTKTFERGVKDFTLACGTGVIASAIVLEEMEKKDVYELEAPGGFLRVKLQQSIVTLIGPAKLTFTGQYPLKKD